MAQLWARQVLCLAACICLAPALAIYEEQAGEHDWLLQHVGHVQHAALGSGNQLIVGTEANAVAALGLDSGAVQVRHRPDMLLPQMHLAPSVFCCHACSAVPCCPPCVSALRCPAPAVLLGSLLTAHVSAGIRDLSEQGQVMSTAAACSRARASCA